MPDAILIIDRDAERRACRRAARDTAAFKMDDMRRVLAAGLAFIDTARDAGLPANHISDFAKGLHDELSDMAAQHDRILDNEGMVPLASLNLGELEQVIERGA